MNTEAPDLPSAWVTVAWACQYLSVGPRFVTDRLIADQERPITGKIRRAKIATTNQTRIRRQDVLSLLPP